MTEGWLVAAAVLAGLIAVAVMVIRRWDRRDDKENDDMGLD